MVLCLNCGLNWYIHDPDDWPKGCPEWHPPGHIVTDPDCLTCLAAIEGEAA